jgi:hypothetical protein
MPLAARIPIQMEKAVKARSTLFAARAALAA